MKVDHNTVVRCVRGGDCSEWKNWGSALYVVIYSGMLKKTGFCFLQKCRGKFKKNFELARDSSSVNPLVNVKNDIVINGLRMNTLERFLDEGLFVVEEELTANYKIFLELEKL